MPEPERRNSIRLVACLLVSAVMICGVGCGSDGVDTSFLKSNWESYQSEHFVFYFPPNSPRISRMAEFAETCEEISAHLCRVLQIVPDRTVECYVFNSDAQSDSLLGRPAGFFEEGNIILRIGQHPGGYVAQATCHFIDKHAPSFDVLKAGIFQLYAQPSVNVHAETFTYERQNRFIPLTDLADTTIARDPAVFSTESASFCAFLLANYGPDRFKMLWSSTLGLSESLNKIYNVELDSFEDEWQRYYRRESGRT